MEFVRLWHTNYAHSRLQPLLENPEGFSNSLHDPGGQWPPGSCTVFSSGGFPAAYTAADRGRPPRRNRSADKPQIPYAGKAHGMRILFVHRGLLYAHKRHRLPSRSAISRCPHRQGLRHIAPEAPDLLLRQEQAGGPDGCLSHPQQLRHQCRLPPPHLTHTDHILLLPRKKGPGIGSVPPIAFQANRP